ncbi:hypothetical protein [Intestinirhabdus alba]|uniref:Uncharacterized protein n=1 Tax=Intestinirhabdus alba TaxID=2899544 RepID=A0A6L6IPE5_9ENTR|nr:hypothetical protein [Intestinirhabdus alba]MTH48742.1 hypothetical protein [Intestinirhabdus alba]
MLFTWLTESSFAGQFHRIVVPGMLFVVWMLAGSLRLVVYLLYHVSANAWDRRREAWILAETRKSRRAFQILSATFRVAGSEDEDGATLPSTLETLLRNKTLITTQTAWNGAAGCYHSSLPRQPGQTPDDVIYTVFLELISSVGVSLVHLPEDNPVAVLLDLSSSVFASRIHTLWHRAWQESGIAQPVAFVDGSGLAYVDEWLNTRIRDEAVLLVVAAQIAPATPEGTGEAAVALLLGNRLTQHRLEPLALLHRPDGSTQAELEQGLTQAAYHVPLNKTTLQHLWLCGLNREQREAVTIQRRSPLLAAVVHDNLHNLDASLGQSGRVAPWLAVAAAAQAAQEQQLPQMIISSDAGHNAIWSAVISPLATRQEAET